MEIPYFHGGPKEVHRASCLVASGFQIIPVGDALRTKYPRSLNRASFVGIDMKQIGLYFLIISIWITGLLIFITIQTKPTNPPAPSVRYEITEAQLEAQKELEQKLETLEQKQKDIESEVQKAQSRYSMLNIDNEAAEKKKTKRK